MSKIASNRACLRHPYRSSVYSTQQLAVIKSVSYILHDLKTGFL
ncbi:hypothetical protein [Amazonocrinis nigriterrae]|nr:hypothetical protein [Amazonocrinis nigriterrae]